jgi:hypothetical protein
VTRFVWSGDQILWELKDATGSYAADAGGRVSYAHAGGIDRPLAIWKQGVGTIVTHQNWRGTCPRQRRCCTKSSMPRPTCRIAAAGSA